MGWEYEHCMDKTNGTPVFSFLTARRLPSPFCRFSGQWNLTGETPDAGAHWRSSGWGEGEHMLKTAVWTLEPKPLTSLSIPSQDIGTQAWEWKVLLWTNWTGPKKKLLPADMWESPHEKGRSQSDISIVKCTVNKPAPLCSVSTALFRIALQRLIVSGGDSRIFTH